MNFSKLLIDWYSEYKRPLAWRETKDAYKIWLSEIIMQQTRIEQGTSYYLKFIEHYPTVNHLAKASEEEVLFHWQGLGYYSRARNLHATAKFISEQLNGVFPNTFSEIVKLKGVGDYTASAIASFAFDEPHPTIDGNVQRVLSRVFGLYEAINTGASKKELSAIANKIIDKKQAATFNQAMMDFGSIHCKAQNPLCDVCPFKKDCYAFGESKINELPVKKKALVKQDRFMYYILPIFSESEKKYTFINQRNQKDIWSKLYDFPLVENNERITYEDLEREISKLFSVEINEKNLKFFEKEYKHILSHRTLYVKFYSLELDFDKAKQINNYQKVELTKLLEFPFPKLIHLFFDDYLP